MPYEPFYERFPETAEKGWSPSCVLLTGDVY